MRFASPIFLIIFPTILALIFYYVNMLNKKKFNPAIHFPMTRFLKSQSPDFKAQLLKICEFLKYAAFVLIIIALARPQMGETIEQSNDEGIDIMIALDTSTSMRSLDFKPLDRMSVAKKVTGDFVKLRKFDKIGLVVFSGLAFTQCPLTTDQDSLVDFIKNINIGDIGVDGTAIGSAIMTAVNRLKDVKTKTKIIILVTDGNNNMGEIDPIAASNIAKDYGIKIYTVGVGSLEGAVYLVDDPFFGKREIRTQDALNENILKQVARSTGGEYFRARDEESFISVMKQIDALEKDKIEVTQIANYNEIYGRFLFPAFLILLIVISLQNTYVRKLP